MRSQHPRANLFTLMKSKHDIGPIGTGKHTMGPTGLPLDGPPDS